MVTETGIVVRSTEVDVYGHVNNAKYLEYLEWGRFDWAEATGLTPERVGPDLGLVVANINVNYRREARTGDRLVVKTRLAARSRRSIRFTQVVVDAAGERVADAEVTAVVFDLRTRRSAEMPDELAARLDALVSPDN